MSDNVVDFYNCKCVFINKYVYFDCIYFFNIDDVSIYYFVEGHKSIRKSNYNYVKELIDNLEGYFEPVESKPLYQFLFERSYHE